MTYLYVLMLDPVLIDEGQALVGVFTTAKAACGHAETYAKNDHWGHALIFEVEPDEPFPPHMEPQWRIDFQQRRQS